jgi:hypothetical protein
MLKNQTVIELGKDILFVLDTIKSKLFDIEDILIDFDEDIPEEVGKAW